jgi:hypothetical protein
LSIIHFQLSIRKAVFCIVKDGLLACKRWLFAARFAVFCKTPCGKAFSGLRASACRKAAALCVSILFPTFGEGVSFGAGKQKKTFLFCR